MQTLTSAEKREGWPQSPNLTLNRENIVEVKNGWLMLPVVLGMHLGSFALLLYSLIAGINQLDHPYWGLFVISILALILSIFLMPGFFTLQPNEARVLVLFGDYKGTVRKSGFFWGNPFYSNSSSQTGGTQHGVLTEGHQGAGKQGTATAGRAKSTRMKVSLRVRNFNSDTLKVNDKRGNPIEIAAVVVWRVQDTAQAMFDVDDFENYVRVQSESALRHLASAYAYDHGEENEVTLRSGMDEVAQALKIELQARLDKAGVHVEEARLTHLAYAPEIAQAMLRRQQAEAVIAARQKIVHGAVSMVEMALKDLADKQVVQLDDERKAAMVSNLMVVLCSESEVHPIVNAGTLYT
jgi:regulator of protease activity HflC (stomatin/prohibitin superfamily)